MMWRTHECAMPLSFAKRRSNQNIPYAWVFHDRYTSIVTVGSYKSKDDPRIAQTQNLFGAKISLIKSDGSPNLGAEAFAIPRKAVANELVKTWIFDPFPQIIEVPR